MNKIKPLFFSLIFLLSAAVHAQETFTISGTIQSAVSGETLIGVTVATGGRGTASNEYGFFSLTLPEGTYKLEISALGMQGETLHVVLDKDVLLNIQLDEATQSLEGVTVTAPSEGRSLSSPQMGVEQLSAQEIKNIPVLLGERDIMKTVQLLPGIKTAGEGNSGFFVRGGAADQNLILLDEAPVYNAS
ncbi:MAG TPA: TonB-dependent receptor, partial [Anseongella sp.]|nr:TonB-dependent receptor [Anseongella sp.]